MSVPKQKRKAELRDQSAVSSVVDRYEVLLDGQSGESLSVSGPLLTLYDEFHSLLAADYDCFISDIKALNPVIPNLNDLA